MPLEWRESIELYIPVHQDLPADIELGSLIPLFVNYINKIQVIINAEN